MTSKLWVFMLWAVGQLSSTHQTLKDGVGGGLMFLSCLHMWGGVRALYDKKMVYGHEIVRNECLDTGYCCPLSIKCFLKIKSDVMVMWKPQTGPVQRL